MFFALLLLIASLNATAVRKRSRSMPTLPREVYVYDADDLENGLGRRLKHAGKKLERKTRHALPKIVDTSRKIAEIGSVLGYDSEDYSYPTEVSVSYPENFNFIIEILQQVSFFCKQFSELSTEEAVQMCSYYLNTPAAEEAVEGVQPYLPYVVKVCDYITNYGNTLSNIPKKYIIAVLCQWLNKDFATQIVETVGAYLPIIIDNSQTYSMIASSIIDVEPAEAIKILNSFLNAKEALKYVGYAQKAVGGISSAIDYILNYLM